MMAKPLISRAAASGILLLLAGHPTRAEVQLHDWESHRLDSGRLSLSGGFKYFSTNSNFDGSGNSVAVSGLDFYRRWSTDLEVRFALHPRLTLFGRTTWLWNSIESQTLVANRFGFSDQTVGANLRLIDQALQLDLQAQADLPAYSNLDAAARGLPYLGDGSTDVTVGAFATLPLALGEPRNYQLTAGAGFTTRTGSFSSAVPWSAQFSTRPSSGAGLVAAAGAAGFQSLRTDPAGNLQINASQATAYSAGSFLINAINPSLAVARASLGYQFTPGSEALFGARHPVWGQAVAEGTTFELQFRWGLEPADSKNRKPPSGKKSAQGPELTRYLTDGKVTGIVNTRTLLVSLGSEAGLSMGDLVDIFSVTPEGTPGEPVARGQVTHLDWNQSEISILEIYRETAIKEGFFARKPIPL